MKTYISHSPEETKKIAQKFLKYKVVALTGELGSGKTTFVQGFAKGLGIKERVISPTFVLIRQHKIPKTKKTLYHVDLYRLDKTNFDNIGINEIITGPQNIVIIEWAEKVEGLLPKGTIWISFENIDSHTKSITVRGPLQ